MKKERYYFERILTQRLWVDAYTPEDAYQLIMELDEDSWDGDVYTDPTIIDVQEVPKDD